MGSRLDHLYRSILLTKFFTRGWGQPDHLLKIIKLRKLLGNRSTAQVLLSNNNTKITITKEEKQDGAILLTGTTTQGTSLLLSWSIFQTYVHHRSTRPTSKQFFLKILELVPGLLCSSLLGLAIISSGGGGS
jgi:hypothetical protein